MAEFRKPSPDGVGRLGLLGVRREYKSAPILARRTMAGKVSSMLVSLAAREGEKGPQNFQKPIQLTTY
jgi:hypothetical protein